MDRSDRDEQVIEYVVRRLSTPVTRAHVHLGQAHTNGGVMVTLCQSEAAPDPTSLAPTSVDEGTVAGTITAEQVVGPGQLREF